MRIINVICSKKYVYPSVEDNYPTEDVWGPYFAKRLA